MSARTISLPAPKTSGKVSLEESLFRRRSQRSFKANDIPLEYLSQILWAAQGITDQTYGFRTAPSAGALYPLFIYVAKNDGVFRYIPDGHKLVELSNTDIRPSLGRASLGQSYIREAALDIIICANFAISQAKYGPRAFRYVCMEIGHVAQNIQLQTVALGLGSVVVGAFWDDVIRTNLKIPENQDPLYIIPIGYYNQ
ncbi:MAG: SagB/ThcOx family dehydrogenase [Candidatus Margulisbacteria bacterium]|nr:SagB/ThcOx family dehydrogenase [Candidatus Margulisiibacteriota bacterium]